ncbi:MAG: AbrB/MazE/SpoVT family DNA-binding domain-containing protein [Alphaproteobacteria bacterium]
MTTAVKVRRIGNSLGLVLTKDLTDALGVAEGDALFAVRTPDGVMLTPYDPDFAAVIEQNRRYMRRHRNALRELAKR